VIGVVCPWLSDVVLLGATIDLLPFEIWAIPAIKEPAQLKSMSSAPNETSACKNSYGARQRRF